MSSKSTELPGGGSVGAWTARGPGRRAIARDAELRASSTASSAAAPSLSCRRRTPRPPSAGETSRAAPAAIRE
eukprot:2870517-Alexandrium_andersonii.AAC.1